MKFPNPLLNSKSKLIIKDRENVFMFSNRGLQNAPLTEDLPRWIVEENREECVKDAK